MRILVTILFSIIICNAGATDVDRAMISENTSDRPVTTAAAATVVTTFPTELTVEGLISLAKGSFCLQMGSFIILENAESLRDRLSLMLGLEVDIINENGLFKVLINSGLKGIAPSLFIPVSFPVSPHREKKLFEPEDMAEARAPSLLMPKDGIEVEASDGFPAVLTRASIETAQRVDTIIVQDTSSQADTPDNGVRRRFNNFFFLKGDSPWLNRYNYFGKSVVLVNALIFTIISSLITMLVLLVIILLNRTKMEKEARLRQYLLEQYQTLIIDYLFGNAGSGIFRPIASDIFRRQVLIEQMIDVSVNLKGETGDKLTRLYKELNLDKDSIQRAKSRSWHVKIKGFRELAFMNIRDANNEMYKALNSKNEILRMEAQIALVRLSEGEPFEFLSHLKKPFSLWEQITLHDLIVQHEIPAPDFSQWLTSPNPTVVMFALRMIREFRQKQSEPEVRKILLHREKDVSQLAIQVAGDLDMRSTLETMKRMYKFQEYNNCLEIVRAMGKMPELSMMGFLRLVLDKEDDVQLQIEAVKAIENMGEEGVKALVKIMKSEYKNYNIIVRHVLDRRIY